MAVHTLFVRLAVIKKAPAQIRVSSHSKTTPSPVRHTMIQVRLSAICMAVTSVLVSGFGLVASAEATLTLNDFYRPFELSEITPKNMQSWPYYRYTSMNWDEYGLFGTVPVMRASNPANLSIADPQFDIEQEIRDDWTFVESLTSTRID